MEEEIIEKEEIKKKKHHFSFKKNMTRIIALFLAVVMVLAVAGTLIYYLV